MHQASEQARRRDHDDRRGTASQRGYSAAWRKARAAFLRAHPLCAGCLPSIVTAASVVDHKVPHRGDMALFWDRDNWQSLCAPCHSRKTASEDGGYGNRAR